MAQAGINWLRFVPLLPLFTLGSATEQHLAVAPCLLAQHLLSSLGDSSDKLEHWRFREEQRFRKQRGGHI